jgi:hypothetical protein
MGVYIYTYKKKFDKNVTINGEGVVVGQATFLCKSDFGGRYTPSENREMRRALNLEKDLQPDYITFDGENVYKNNKRGLWHDGSGFYCGIHYKNDFVGVLKKEGRKYVIKNITKDLADLKI